MVVDDEYYDVGFDYCLFGLFGYFIYDFVFGDGFEVIGIDY